MLLSSSDTRVTLMYLFLFTNSTQRELVSICTQSIRNPNYLSLHYYLGINERGKFQRGGGVKRKLHSSVHMPHLIVDK